MIFQTEERCDNRAPEIQEEGVLRVISPFLGVQINPLLFQRIPEKN